jgi:3-deoxy-manno-octulosonate cytidylyltransferase (CMP-KDO synthetase)
MAEILGKPMIGHVYERVAKSELLLMTAVATCDHEIYDYIESIGGTAVMTADTYERASDRCAEALLKLEKDNNVKYDIVVMVQGDEPLVNPSLLDDLTKIFEDETIDIVNVMTRFSDVDDYTDRNNIKVVIDRDSDALYFSRQPIPFDPTQLNVNKAFMQTGIIAFRRDTLLDFNEIPESFLEVCESIDMNRVIENQGKVKMHLTADILIGVDVEADIAKVEELMKIDDLYLDYSLNSPRSKDVL